MKYVVATLFALVPVVAFAQEKPKEFNLKIDGADIQTIGEGLGMLPYGKVAPLMQKLQIQINEQNASKSPAPTKPEEKK